MDNNVLIEEIVNQVLKTMASCKDKPVVEAKAIVEEIRDQKKLTQNDYPLGQKRKDLIKTKTGKKLEDITIEEVLNGNVTPEDIKITPEVLLYQAEIAESVGRNQFATNLRRAAELTLVPDARVLEIYNALRPYRSTKQELIDIADELENKYNAKMNANLVREAAEIYEKRGRLKV